GPAGTTVLFDKTWFNANSPWQAPFVVCCDTSKVNEAAVGGTVGVTVPGTTVANVTTHARTYIQIVATIPMLVTGGARLQCQPNIDEKWAGAKPNTPTVWFDYVWALNTGGLTTVTISRLYPSPGDGQHTFTIACANQGGSFGLHPNTMVSF